MPNKNPTSHFEIWGFKIQSMATSGFGLVHLFFPADGGKIQATRSAGGR
jgi:hypothetical protein